ncbi:hypothetical protein D1872_232950 [compost metagenome]
MTFDELYASVADIKRWHRWRVVSSGAGDVYDADSSFDDVVLRLAGRDDITDFRRLLYVYLKYKRIDIYRKNTQWKARTYYPEQDTEFGAITDRPQPDRAGFIRELIDRSGEETAALIADMALKTDGNESISALAERMGTHHHAAFRSLRRLRRYYNPEIDGSLAEYLA